MPVVQSPGTGFHAVVLSRRLPRRFAPRNDVVIFGWSFCIKNPRPIRTGEILFRGSRSVGLRPPTPPFMVGTGTTARVAPTRRCSAVRTPREGYPYGMLCPSPVGNGPRAAAQVAPKSPAQDGESAPYSRNLVIARPQAVAISWYGVPCCGPFQEIATSVFDLLAKTW